MAGFIVQTYLEYANEDEFSSKICIFQIIGLNYFLYEVVCFLLHFKLNCNWSLVKTA